MDDEDTNRKAYADVIILVERNENGPKFERSEYRQSVSDKQLLGEPLGEPVKAEDEDGVSLNEMEYLILLILH